MGGMLMAIVPIISGLMGGATPVAVLGGLSLTQWAALAGAILNLEGADIEAALKKNPELIGLIAALRQNPVIEKLVSDVKNVGANAAANLAHQSAQTEYAATSRADLHELFPTWPAGDSQ